ncbi:MAG: Trk system potassium transporter TrkA [Lachnospiraceae bacterium]|nr:Trk system potassium transporter TrkA [Lachnospiraceae bacterium]
MKIIVIGLGRTGHLLISALASENYDIVVIDKERKLIDEITDRYSVNGIVGSGASRETLLAAGAATADAIVALTPIDEINLLSCLQAKNLGTRYAAARITMPDFVKESEALKEEYLIDFIFKPREDVAEEIYENIGMPGNTKLVGSWKSGLHLMDLNVLEDSVMCGRTLLDIKRSSHLNMLVVAVLRAGKLTIPDGNFVINAGDNLTVAVADEEFSGTLKSLGIIRKKVKKVMIVGGNTISEYLLERMEKDGYQITVLEKDTNRCRELMERFRHCRILCTGEGELLEILKEENLSEMDMVVSLTDSDEANLVISMYSWSCHIPSVITYVEVTEHLRLLHSVNIDITVSAVETAALKAMRFIRYHEDDFSKKEIGKFYLVADGKAEIRELLAGDDFKLLNVEFKEKEFRLKKGVLITAIIRDDKMIVPTGSTSIKAGDQVIITTSRKLRIRHLNDIL